MAYPYRVVIAEDEAVLRQTLAMALTMAGYSVLTAANGREALDHFEENTVDAVLLDAYMPVMDGFITCKLIRHMPGGELIPIVFITGSDEPSVINNAFDCGATDFVRKPVAFAGLTQRLGRLIESSRGHAALRQAQSLVENMSDMAFWLGEEGRIGFANPAACKRMGYAAEELIGQNFWLLCQSVQAEPLHTLSEILHKEGRLKAEVILQTKAGAECSGELLVSSVPGNNVREYSAIVRDISELRARQAELQAVADHAPDLIIRMECDGRILFVNRASERFTGQPAESLLNRYPAAAGLPTVVADALTERLAEVLGTGKSTIFQLDYPFPTSGRILEVVAAPERMLRNRVETVIFFFRDITEQKRNEDERLKADRLRTMGVLAGGVAHDFNNIITALMNVNALALLELPADSPATIILREGQPAMDQAIKLSQQLLTFAKGGAPIKTVTDIGRLVRDTASFAMRGTRSVVVLMIPQDLWFAEVDEGQINQVLSNLIINADQSMSNGGYIRVSLANEMVPEGNSPNLMPGPYLRLVISDTGCGIPQQIMHQVFDPYFTTKKNGSGLGLTTAISVIKRHGGHIEIDSKEDMGTSIHCLIPANPEGQLPRAIVGTTQNTLGGKILVLEDQEIISKGLKQLLTKAGYCVTLTSHGQETISVFTRAAMNREPFDLLILDMTIPAGIGGLEVITQLKVFDPKVRAIVSSGYSEDPVMSDPAHYGFSGVLRKPFSREQLLQTISDVLSR